MKSSTNTVDRAGAAAASADLKPAIAPPAVPADSAIDRAHLTRMTFGEASLQREVLQLFDRQADMLLARMAGETPKIAAALAHTLKGSAQGIGAHQVAQAAEAVEQAASASHADSIAAAIERLSDSVAHARAAIRVLLRAN
jgi:HPt (histidine-containing phosphotransfer) domain-containing protein